MKNFTNTLEENSGKIIAFFALTFIPCLIVVVKTALSQI